MQKVANRNGLARGDRKRRLNDGQIPTVRVHASTGLCEEGNRRRPRGRSPTRNPERNRFATCPSLYVASQLQRHLLTRVSGLRPGLTTHLLVVEHHLQSLRGALAVARALNRTLLLPELPCYCDKTWGGHDNIFKSQCMYPGAQVCWGPGACVMLCARATDASKREHDATRMISPSRSSLELGVGRSQRVVLKKLRIVTCGISGGRSLTRPFRDARRFPSPRL
jgi:hypothetical protein